MWVVNKYIRGSGCHFLRKQWVWAKTSVREAYSKKYELLMLNRWIVLLRVLGVNYRPLWFSSKLSFTFCVNTVLSRICRHCQSMWLLSFYGCLDVDPFIWFSFAEPALGEKNKVQFFGSSSLHLYRYNALDTHIIVVLRVCSDLLYKRNLHGPVVYNFKCFGIP